MVREIGKNTLFLLARAGHKQNVLELQTVVLARVNLAKSRKGSPPRFATTTAPGKFKTMWVWNAEIMSLHLLLKAVALTSDLSGGSDRM